MKKTCYDIALVALWGTFLQYNVILMVIKYSIDDAVLLVLTLPRYTV